MARGKRGAAPLNRFSAITVSTPTYEDVSRVAETYEMSRLAVVTVAIERFLDDLQVNPKILAAFGKRAEIKKVQQMLMKLQEEERAMHNGHGHAPKVKKGKKRGPYQKHNKEFWEGGGQAGRLRREGHVEGGRVASPQQHEAAPPQ